ncbi:hypothetical protein AB0L63_19720 [Nocardia sp. NPDC051990]|uniref:hypothetical protein n=1 Tax=Nocardia sp. NPDC051990 TaxID=3155285 RepID=UPI0034205964
MHRIELYVEPWDTDSIRVAEFGGYLREGLLRSYQGIGWHSTRHARYATTRLTP